MKFRIFILSLMVALISGVSYADHAPVAVAGKNPIASTIYLKNNSLLPKRVTLVSYGPLLKTERIERVIMLPGQTITRTYTVKTKLFVADKEERRALKNGERINKGEPFLIVKKKVDDKRFELFEKKL